MNRNEKLARMASLENSIKRINKALFALSMARYDKDMPIIGESPERILINHRTLFALEKLEITISIAKEEEK